MKHPTRLRHKTLALAGKRWAALSIALFLAALAAPTAPALEVGEYEIKGAMIVNFVRFVEWPRDVFKSPDAPIVIGVLGTDDFRDAFVPIQDRIVSGRRLSVNYLDAVSGSAGCHVLFVGRSQSYRLVQVLMAVANLPILTIGETREFTRRGGMIRFFWEDRHVHFEINKSSVNDAGLRVSAKLLEIARIVH